MMKLPLESNTNFFAALFRRQHRQRRSALGQGAFTRLEIIAVTVIVTAQQSAVEKLSGGFQIGFLVRAGSREREIFPLGKRQEHLTPAEVDLFQAAGR